MSGDLEDLGCFRIAKVRCDDRECCDPWLSFKMGDNGRDGDGAKANGEEGRELGTRRGCEGEVFFCSFILRRAPSDFRLWITQDGCGLDL